VGATLRILGESFGYRQLLRTIRFTTGFMEVMATSNERVADLMSLHPAFGRAGISRAQALEICRVVATPPASRRSRRAAPSRPWR
jgi:hypothetical protein